MEHKDFQEKLLMLIYNELDPQEAKDTEEHAQTCQPCRKRLEEIRAVHSMLRAKQPSDALLQEARNDLRAALRAERNRPARSETLFAWLNPLVPYLKPAGVLAAALFLGIWIGGFAFAPKQNQMATGNPLEVSGVGITNVRFIDADASDGEVEFAFDAVKPMKFKGDISDERIQKILTYAVVREQNAGVRLRAINAIESSPFSERNDETIQRALVAAIKSDPNVGVRKEGLQVLQKMRMNEELKEAFLYVLRNDENPAMRILAIQSLEGRKIQENDQEVVNVLRDRMKTDENKYIRTKAERLLQEVSEP